MPQPLSRVQFKNWRSLRDVTIDFDTPITVFIGANASGKTNIIDGLRFLQQAEAFGILTVALAYQGDGQLRTFGQPSDAPITIETTMQPQKNEAAQNYRIEIRGEAGKFSLQETLYDDNQHIDSKMSDFRDRQALLLRAFQPRDGQDHHVVIEEPDTALNPGLLARFVGQLREYVHDKPRQIILTTHNPAFLNYFEPEEMRVVQRGDDGNTQVMRVPDYVRELWLDEFALGEVWSANSFGALAQ
jgi:predicted ATPase